MTAPRRELIEKNQGRPSRTVLVADVLRFEACRKYVVAHTAAGLFTLRDSLRTLEAEFSAQFVRVHSAHLVARALIRHLVYQYDRVYHIELTGVLSRVPVSRGAYPRLIRERPDLQRLTSV